MERSMKFKRISAGEDWEVWRVGAWFYLKDLQTNQGHWVHISETRHD